MDRHKNNHMDYISKSQIKILDELGENVTIEHINSISNMLKCYESKDAEQYYRENTNKFISLCLNHMKCLMLYYGTRQNKSVDKQPQLKEHLNILVKIFTIHPIKGALDTITLPIFDTIMDPSIPFFCAFELVKATINIIRNYHKSARLNIFSNRNRIYLLQLMDHLCICGDFDYQVAILELLFRICPDIVSENNANELFPGNAVLQKALGEVREDNFDVDARFFLNKINLCNGSIISIEAESVVIGKHRISPPNEFIEYNSNSPKLWIDFNTKSLSLNIQCSSDSMMIEPPETPSNNNWEMIIIHSSKVKKIYFQKISLNKTKKHVLIIDLNEAVKVCYQSSYEVANNARNIKMILTDDTDMQRLITCLQTIFRDKLKLEINKIKFDNTKEDAIKPLNIFTISKPKISKSVPSIKSLTSAIISPPLNESRSIALINEFDSIIDTRPEQNSEFFTCPDILISKEITTQDCILKTMVLNKSLPIDLELINQSSNADESGAVNIRKVEEHINKNKQNVVDSQVLISNNDVQKSFKLKMPYKTRKNVSRASNLDSISEDEENIYTTTTTKAPQTDEYNFFIKNIPKTISSPYDANKVSKNSNENKVLVSKVLFNKSENQSNQENILNNIKDNKHMFDVASSSLEVVKDDDSLLFNCFITKGNYITPISQETDFDSLKLSGSSSYYTNIAESVKARKVIVEKKSGKRISQTQNLTNLEAISSSGTLVPEIDNFHADVQVINQNNQSQSSSEENSRRVLQEINKSGIKNIPITYNKDAKTLNSPKFERVTKGEKVINEIDKLTKEEFNNSEEENDSKKIPPIKNNKKIIKKVPKRRTKSIKSNDVNGKLTMSVEPRRSTRQILKNNNKIDKQKKEINYNEESDENIEIEKNLEAPNIHEELHVKKRPKINILSDIKLTKNKAMKNYKSLMDKKSSEKVNTESIDEIDEKSSEEVDNQSSEKMGNNSSQEVNKESSEDMHKTSSGAVNKKSSVKMYKKSFVEVDKESSEEVDKKSSVEVDKESSEEVDKNLSEEVNKKSSVEVDNKSPEEVDKNVSEKVDKKSSVEVDKESSEEMDKNLSEEVDKKSSVEVIKESSEEMYKQSSKNVDKNVYEEMDKKSSVKVDKKSYDEMYTKLSDEVNKQSSEEVDKKLSKVDKKSSKEVDTTENLILKVANTPNSVAMPKRKYQRKKESKLPKVNKITKKTSNAKSNKQSTMDAFFTKEKINTSDTIAKTLTKDKNNAILSNSEDILNETPDINTDQLIIDENYDGIINDDGLAINHKFTINDKIQNDDEIQKKEIKINAAINTNESTQNEKIQNEKSNINVNIENYPTKINDKILNDETKIHNIQNKTNIKDMIPNDEPKISDNIQNHETDINDKIQNDKTKIIKINQNFDTITKKIKNNDTKIHKNIQNDESKIKDKIQNNETKINKKIQNDDTKIKKKSKNDDKKKHKILNNESKIKDKIENNETIITNKIQNDEPNNDLFLNNESTINDKIDDTFLPNDESINDNLLLKNDSKSKTKLKEKKRKHKSVDQNDFEKFCLLQLSEKPTKNIKMDGRKSFSDLIVDKHALFDDVTKTESNVVSINQEISKNIISMINAENSTSEQHSDEHVIEECANLIKGTETNAILEADIFEIDTQLRTQDEVINIAEGANDNNIDLVNDVIKLATNEEIDASIAPIDALEFNNSCGSFMDVDAKSTKSMTSSEVSTFYGKKYAELMKIKHDAKKRNNVLGERLSQSETNLQSTGMIKKPGFRKLYNPNDLSYLMDESIANDHENNTTLDCIASTAQLNTTIKRKYVRKNNTSKNIENMNKPTRKRKRVHSDEDTSKYEKATKPKRQYKKKPKMDPTISKNITNIEQEIAEINSILEDTSKNEKEINRKRQYKNKQKNSSQNHETLDDNNIMNIEPETSGTNFMNSIIEQYKKKKEVPVIHQNNRKSNSPAKSPFQTKLNQNEVSKQIIALAKQIQADFRCMYKRYRKLGQLVLDFQSLNK